MKILNLILVITATGFFSICGYTQTNNFELGVRLGYVASIDVTVPVNAYRIHSNLGWGIDYYLFDNCFDFRIPLNKKNG